MKTDANWLLRAGTGVLTLSFAIAVASCGKGGGMNSLSSSTATKPAGTQTALTPQTITGADDIAKLPPDQQKLFTDPGWNQPYITPDPATQGLTAPSTDELLRLTREKMAAGDQLAPRGMAPPPSGAKSASWVALGSDAYSNNSPPYGGSNNVPPYDHVATILQGEYYQFQFNATPTYGCNADGSNEGFGSTHHAIEDTLAGYNVAQLGGANQPINYVLEALPATNWFNTNGLPNNHGNNSQAAIYQEWCSTKAGQPDATPPFNPTPTDAIFAEMSFRSNLTAYGAGPGGGPAGGGTICFNGTNPTHGVKGFFWRCFNSLNAAQPGTTPTANYNILIAPADEGNGVGSADPSFKSSGGTQTEYQTFYFGTVGACYGGAQIVGLTATSSSCSAFSDVFTVGKPTYHPGFFYNPVYGVVLKRWQQLAPPGQGAWKGPLGSPVFGPIAYNSGAATVQPGKKWYAWGWYFEAGFMWYVDNDQTLFPNTPDEAQVYTYSGSNTYCPGGTYTQQLPSTFFLGNSNSLFKVNVGVTGYSADDTTYKAPFFNTTLGRYQIGMVAQGATNEQVYIAANCSGYGGQPDASCNYGSVIWAWRDGSITGPFTYAQGQNQKHLYAGVQQGKPGQNKQNIYVLRVQLTDTIGNIAYGDSLPIELGGVSTLPDGDVLVVKATTNSANAQNNYSAIIADLNSIKTKLPNFTYTEETYGGSTLTDAKKYRVVIWYMGGPDGQFPTLDNETYTSAMAGDMKNIMAAPNPRPILNFSQNLGIGQGAGSYYVGYGGWLWWLNPVATPATPTSGSFNTPDTFLGAVAALKSCTNSGYTGMPASGLNVLQEFGSDYSYNQDVLYYYYNSSAIGETYSGVNYSGQIPSQSGSTANGPWSHRQITLFSDNGQGVPPGLGGTVRGATMQGYWDFGDCESVGNTSSGTKNYVVSYPWSNAGNSLSPGTCQRWHIMLNMLASLDNTIGSGTNGGNSFGSYSGTPEIVSVTPHQFLNAGGVNQGNTSVNGTTYPDNVAAPGFDQNVYRRTNTGLPGGSNYVINSAARSAVVGVGDDTINANDAQFDFPFYAYVVDPNGSVGAGGTGTLSGDETITYGGLLLVNNGTWTRVNPAGAGYKPWATLTAGLASNLQKSAAGYYWGTAGTFGGTVRASYGTQIPNLTFDNRDGAVSFECIAHWPTSLTYFTNPATVRWSLYPAHGVNDINNPGHYYGERSSFFTKWISDTDIDPSVTPPATWGSPPVAAPKRSGANTFSFNIPDFNYVGNLGQGRVADFNYGTVKGWDGDLDRDNVRGEDGITVGVTPDDKFPARCRIFTNFAKYLGYTPSDTSSPQKWVNLGYGLTGFPDNVPDPTSFIEGGCYVVDKGPAITKVAITDDPAKTDPKDNVSSPAANIYDVKLGFIILYGDPGYVVEYNPDFTGTGIWAVVPGLPNNTTDPMDPVNGYPANGSHFPTVRVTQPISGDYTFAVRVTDLKPAVGGDLSAVYSWPNKVPLKPPMKTALLCEPSDDSPGGPGPAGKDVTKMKADIETIYGAGSVDIFTVPQVSAGLAANSLNNYDIIAWPVDIKGFNDVQNRFFNFGIPWTPGPGQINFTTIKTAHVSNKAAVLMFGQDSYGTGTAWNTTNYFSGDLRNILPIQGPNTGFWTSWYYDGSYPDVGGGTGYNIFGSASTTPNTVGNMTGLDGPNDPGGSWSAFAASSNFLKSVTDPTNYPSGNCEHFSASWYQVFGNTYICGSFARRNVSTDQALVMFNANWGDLLTNQGTKTRAAVLENLLCAGKATSRYNSLSYNP
jgi:hypothetical protein